MPRERLTPDRRRDLTRRTLIDAAAEVFAGRGFHAASLHGVASAEGRTLPVGATDLAYMLRAFSDGLAQLAAVDEDRAAYYDGLAMHFFGLIERAMRVPDEETERESERKPKRGS